jgi:hypothetical protein|tara:strand:+ start:284 stop:499 length:216 start_codon:yes stop_codon:yes gene_type:complete
MLGIGNEGIATEGFNKGIGNEGGPDLGIEIRFSCVQSLFLATLAKSRICALFSSLPSILPGFKIGANKSTA